MRRKSIILIKMEVVIAAMVKALPVVVRVILEATPATLEALLATVAVM